MRRNRDSAPTDQGHTPGVDITPVRLSEAIAAGRSLTDRDHQVITLLGEHQALTAEQIARVAFPNDHRARHRLVELTRRGVLARFRHCHRPGSLPWRYTLGLLGAAIRAAETGAPLPDRMRSPNGSPACTTPARWTICSA